MKLSNNSLDFSRLPTNTQDEIDKIEQEENKNTQNAIKSLQIITFHNAELFIFVNFASS